MNPRSRAHRILRPMERYRALGPSGDQHLRLPTLAPGEFWIGLYDNAPGSRDAVAFSTESLHILDRHGWRSIRYADIETNSIIDEKHGVEEILVVTSSVTVTVPIRGGTGRLRDAWSVLRFLDRVVEDARAETGSAALPDEVVAAR